MAFTIAMKVPSFSKPRFLYSNLKIYRTIFGQNIVQLFKIKIITRDFRKIHLCPTPTMMWIFILLPCGNLHLSLTKYSRPETWSESWYSRFIGTQNVAHLSYIPDHFFNALSVGSVSLYMFACSGLLSTRPIFPCIYNQFNSFFSWFKPSFTFSFAIQTWIFFALNLVYSLY